MKEKSELAHHLQTVILLFCVILFNKFCVLQCVKLAPDSESFKWWLVVIGVCGLICVFLLAVIFYFSWKVIRIQRILFSLFKQTMPPAILRRVTASKGASFSDRLDSSCFVFGDIVGKKFW